MMAIPALLILLLVLIGFALLLARHRRPARTAAVIPRHAIVVDGSNVMH